MSRHELKKPTFPPPPPTRMPPALDPWPTTDLPNRVVVGANGAYWRDYGDGYSMCPVSEDNDPVDPIAVYVREAATPPALDEHVNVVAIGEAATSALDEFDNLRWDDIWTAVATVDPGLADDSRKYASYVRADIEKVISELTLSTSESPSDPERLPWSHSPRCSYERGETGEHSCSCGLFAFRVARLIPEVAQPASTCRCCGAFERDWQLAYTDPGDPLPLAATPPALDVERLRDALTEWAVEFLGGLSFNVPVLRRQGWAAKRAPDVADSILADPAILAVLSTGDET